MTSFFQFSVRHGETKIHFTLANAVSLEVEPSGLKFNPEI